MSQSVEDMTYDEKEAEITRLRARVDALEYENSRLRETNEMREESGSGHQAAAIEFAGMARAKDAALDEIETALKALRKVAKEARKL